MSYDLCKNIGWLNLLDGANKFELFDLLTAVETYLIDEQNEWIQQNILTVHNLAVSNASLNRLLAYCNRIMVSHPDVLFKSNDLATLPKETLITLLKSDELSMAEDDIWTSVVQWGIKQVPELELGIDSDDWSSNDTNTIKDIIADCIPHIRFFNIPHKKFIVYEDLLPKRLRHDVLNYHADKDYKPKTPLLPPRTGQACLLPPKTGYEYDIDSVIINNKQAEWISSKIVESTRRLQNQKTSMNQNDVYKFTLLYRQSRDGRSIAKFWELCSHKGATIVVGKVSDTEEILGGYNPLSWNNKWKNGKYVSTQESFIFALDKNIDESIISFVYDSSCAIYHHKDNFPAFGGGIDLCFGNENFNPFTKKQSYQFAIRPSAGRFEWADWEVFLVSKS